MSYAMDEVYLSSGPTVPVVAFARLARDRSRAMPVEYLGGLAGHQGAPKKGATCTLIGEADGLHNPPLERPRAGQAQLDPGGDLRVAGRAPHRGGEHEAQPGERGCDRVLRRARPGGEPAAGTHIAVSAGTTDALFLSEDAHRSARESGWLG
jgi:hypothetical protein